MRQNEKKKVRNLRKKREIKKLEKNIAKLALDNKKDEASKLLPRYYKTIDKTAKTGFIKKGQAARKKSKITRLLANIKK